MKRVRSSTLRQFFETDSEKRFRRDVNNQPYSPEILSIIEDMRREICNRLTPVERVMVALTCKEGLVRFKSDVDMLHGRHLFQAAMLLEDSVLFKYLFEERLYYSMKSGVTYTPDSYTQAYTKQLTHMTGMALELETLDPLRFLKGIFRWDVLQNPLCRCPSLPCEEICCYGDDHRCHLMSKYDETYHICNPHIGCLIMLAFELGYYPKTIDVFNYLHHKTHLFLSVYWTPGEYKKQAMERFFLFQKYNIETRNAKLFAHVLYSIKHDPALRYQTFRALESFVPYTTTSIKPEHNYLSEFYKIFQSACYTTWINNSHFEIMMQNNCPLRYHLYHVIEDSALRVRLETLPSLLIAFGIKYGKTALLNEIIEHYDLSAYDTLIVASSVKLHYQECFGGWDEDAWNKFLSHVIHYMSKEELLGLTNVSTHE